MAKKKPPQETGPGVFMILALVFFVLTTAVLGVTTYLGFEGETKWQKEAEAAREKEKAAAKNANEQTMRRDVLRIAVGSDDAQDREDLSGGAKEHSAAILDEHKKLMDKLGTATAFPTKGDFNWQLVNELAKGGGDSDSKPAPAPNKTIPAIAKQWARMYADMKTQFDAQVAARKKAELAAQAAQDAKDQAEDSYKKSLADLSSQMKNKTDAMDKAFAALKTEAEKAGLNFKKQADDWADAKAKLDESIGNLKNDLLAKDQRIKNLQNPDASDIEFKFRHWDVAKTAERMGNVAEKSGTFVSVNFAKPMHLVPGQTFVVIPPTGSLVEVLDREKALEKHHNEVVSLGARDPFADNEMIKGMVEITDVLSTTAARARITYQSNEIRNPIGKGDQLFNVSLSTGEKEHVAFAGIIDLDGDGRPDNENFVRILERNNLAIDAYLDLKTGEIKRRPGSNGIDFKTKFLIIGSDAPIVGNVRVMIDQAKEKGVQLIDARMFLNLIGVKPPRGAAPPAYTTVNLGGEGALAPKKEDDGAPMPPAVPAVPEKEKKKN